MPSIYFSLFSPLDTTGKIIIIIIIILLFIILILINFLIFIAIFHSNVKANKLINKYKMIRTSMKTWRLGLIVWKTYLKGHIYHPFFNSRVQNWKKCSIQGIFGQNCLAHNPRVQSSNPKTKDMKMLRKKRSPRSLPL